MTATFDIPSNLVPYIAKVAVGQLEKLGVFGNDYPTPDGTGVRDYIHVVDLAKGHVKALKKIEQKAGLCIYNLGTGQGYGVLEIVKAFSEASGKELPYEIVPPRAGDVAICYADASKAKKELGFAEDEICILSSGGSLGSEVLNENVARILKWYQDKNVRVNHIHSYGTYVEYANYIDRLEEQGIKVKNNPRLIVKEYINMPLCMAAADLVITRCGASTLAELEAVGRGAILIPSPMVAENHQYHNGMVLQNAGAGFVYEEKNLKDDTIINKLEELIASI